jgi:membrane associated rhomboid family serine protease
MPAVPAPAAPRGSDADDRRSFDPTGWVGGLIVMGVICAALWVVQIVNSAAGLDLAQYGLRPRDVSGLKGVVTGPFLHRGFGRLFANSVPFILLGWVVLRGGVRSFLAATAIIVLGGGLIAWLVAPSVAPGHAIVGSSTLIIGWLGYVLGRAYFSRKVRWIIVAVLVVFFFGTLLGSLLPSVGSSVPWEAEVASFVAGVLASWLLHPRSKRGRLPRPRVTSPGPAASPNSGVTGEALS